MMDNRDESPSAGNDGNDNNIDNNEDMKDSEETKKIGDEGEDDEEFYDADKNANVCDNTSNNSGNSGSESISPIVLAVNTREKRRISKPARYDDDEQVSPIEKRLRDDKFDQVVQNIVDTINRAESVPVTNSDPNVQIVSSKVSSGNKKMIYRILYIDNNIDEKASSDILQQSISRATDSINNEIVCAVDCASNAFTALEMTECIAYDAIFTSLHLSVINSIDILNILRRVGCPAPIVLVVPDSGYEKVMDVPYYNQLEEYYQKLGFFRVLFQPFSVISLNNIFRELIDHNLSPSHLKIVETYVKAHKDISQ